MGFYAKHVLPRLIHLACGTKPIRRQREKVVPLAEGEVLEIGMGSGLNLPYYDPGKVTRVWGLEPDSQIRKMAIAAAAASSLDVRFLEEVAEELPLEDESVDSVLVTYTLCSILEPEKALRSMARVLRPGGRLIFCEHGLAPDPSVRRWQRRLEPAWKRLAGGCHLTRPIPQLIERGGFFVENLETMYLPGFRAATFNYWGTAGIR